MVVTECVTVKSGTFEDATAKAVGIVDVPVVM